MHGIYSKSYVLSNAVNFKTLLCLLFPMYSFGILQKFSANSVLVNATLSAVNLETPVT